MLYRTESGMYGVAQCEIKTQQLTSGLGPMSLMPVKASHQDMKTPEARSTGAQAGSERPTRSAKVCGLACLQHSFVTPLIFRISTQG